MLKTALGSYTPQPVTNSGVLWFFLPLDFLPGNSLRAKFGLCLSTWENSTDPLDFTSLLSLSCPDERSGLELLPTQCSLGLSWLPPREKYRSDGVE